MSPTYLFEVICGLEPGFERGGADICMYTFCLGCLLSYVHYIYNMFISYAHTGMITTYEHL